MHPALALTLVRQQWPRSTVLTDILLVLVGSVFVTVLAQVSIPLPFTPVPITGQTFAVLLVGATLGAWRGAASLALYVGEGSLGLPVFAAGAAGTAHLLGPTGGYLVGFVAAAFIVGHLAERGLDRRWRTALPTFLAGEIVIFLLGVSWLAGFIGWDKALAGGLWPFLPGDALKLLLATIALPSAWALIKGVTR